MTKMTIKKDDGEEDDKDNDKEEYEDNNFKKLC